MRSKSESENWKKRANFDALKFRKEKKHEIEHR